MLPSILYGIFDGINYFVVTENGLVCLCTEDSNKYGVLEFLTYIFEGVEYIIPVGDLVIQQR